MSESKHFAQTRIAIALLSGLIFAPGAPAAPTTAPSLPPAAASAKPEPKELPSLAEILTAAEARDSDVRDIERRLQDRQRIDEIATEIGLMQKAFGTARRSTGQPLLEQANVYELADLQLTTRRGSDRLKLAIDELTAKARALDSDLDRLAANERAWRERLEAARARNAPLALRERIETIAPSDAALARNVRAHRDYILGVLGRASGLYGEMSAALGELESRGALLLTQMKTARGAPLWQAQPQPEEFDRVRAFAATEIGRVLRYLGAHAQLLLAIGVLAFGLSYGLIFATRGRIAREAKTDFRARRTADLFHLPGVAAWVVALLALVWYAPAAPLIYYNLLWSLIPIPAALLAHNLLGPKINLSLFTLALTVMSVSLLGTLDLLPLISRLALIGQCLLLGAALAVDLQRGGIAQAFPAIAPATIRRLAGAAIALLALGVAANVLGYLGISRTLRNGVLGALGFGLVLTVTAHLIYGLLLALMQTRTAQRLRMVRLQSLALQRGLFKLLRAAALLAWLTGTAMAFGLGVKLFELARSLPKASVQIGSLTLSMEGIFAGLLVLAATFVLVKIIRWVMEIEVLPRLALKSGVPFAISTLSGYLLIIVGVVLSLAAMGIDLTKVSLLAGALGVGIGFGLQSVVNNFVSGLILLVERPISVGDTIQTQDLWGEVQRIGVRSSTVRTFQGAEVIVPNADLITKEVTNWTLSDRRRRLEIDVGVAYGSAPEQVVRLLEAAAQEVEDVLANPPPWAWFTNFGDSALNFRLHAWIDNYERGPAAQSALRVAILKQLTEAGIEIPFPQRDINIRSAPGWPPGAPQVEKTKSDIPD